MKLQYSCYVWSRCRLLTEKIEITKNSIWRYPHFGPRWNEIRNIYYNFSKMWHESCYMQYDAWICSRHNLLAYVKVRFEIDRILKELLFACFNHWRSGHFDFFQNEFAENNFSFYFYRLLRYGETQGNVW